MCGSVYRRYRRQIESEEAMSWANATKEHQISLVLPGLSSVTTDPPKGVKRRSQHCMHKNKVEDDDLTEKKRRLTVEEVNFLETCFNIDTKLEPERKALLAKQLGVRPRQVAIWFQNRRARWKNKQVEQDYEMLKTSYDAVEKEKESLIKEYEAALEGNKRLHAEVERLTSLLQTTNDDNATANNNNNNMESPTNGEQESRRRNKSELMSPTKSVDAQSEIDNVVLLSDAADGAMTSASVEELDSATARDGGKHDGDDAPFLPSHVIVSSLPELVQQLIANGCSLEDAMHIFLSCEDHFSSGFSLYEAW